MHAAYVLVALVTAGAAPGAGLFAVAQQAQAHDALAAVSCDAALDGMDVATIALPQCRAKKAAFCRRFATRDGLAIVLEQGERAQADAAKLCGKDVARIQAALCPAAAKEYARGGARAVEALVFIGQSCPDEATPIAKRECAGRSYTDLEGAFREFCAAFARRALDAGELEVAPAKGAPEENPAPRGIDPGGAVPKGNPTR